MPGDPANGTSFSADQEIAEYDGATLLRRYVRLPGSVDEPILMIDYTLPANDRERWAHQNRQGSVVALTDASGALVEQFRYAPYGQAGAEGPAGFPFRFTGQKLDAETGLYYYKARYYDPDTGRFLQTDPVGYEDDLNLYEYVSNDPLNRTDPTGRQERDRRYGPRWDPFFTNNPWIPGTPANQEWVQGIKDWWSGIFNNEQAEPPTPPSVPGIAPDGAPVYPGEGRGGRPGFTGEPGSWQSGPRGDRKYGPDGYPEKDVDYPSEGAEADLG